MIAAYHATGINRFSVHAGCANVVKGFPNYGVFQKVNILGSHNGSGGVFGIL